LSNVAYLLDTNVVSEGRRKVPDPNVLSFVGSISPSDSFVSVLTIGELRKGVQMRRKTDPVGADRLQSWLDDVTTDFGERILPIDLAVAKVWGELSAVRLRPVVDALIAATAIVRNLTLVTRNVRDLADTGAACINPWA
jgi:predicted nucleic acid-binding protein